MTLFTADSKYGTGTEHHINALKADTKSVSIGIVASNHRVQAGRRIMAAVPYDFLVYYWLSACLIGSVSLLTGGASLPYTPLALLTLCLYLTRDFPFQGRGIGKNLLELQVVDQKSGMPATLRQCLVRNFVLVGPLLVMEVVAFALSLLHCPASEAVGVGKIIAMGCFTVLLIIESIRMHVGSGLRLADRIAGTIVVKANTDFSNPLSRLHTRVT